MGALGPQISASSRRFRREPEKNCIGVSAATPHPGENTMNALPRDRTLEILFTNPIWRLGGDVVLVVPGWGNTPVLRLHWE